MECRDTMTKTKDGETLIYFCKRNSCPTLWWLARVNEGENDGVEEVEEGIAERMRAKQSYLSIHLSIHLFNYQRRQEVQIHTRSFKPSRTTKKKKRMES